MLVVSGWASCNSRIGPAMRAMTLAATASARRAASSYVCGPGGSMMTNSSPPKARHQVGFAHALLEPARHRLQQFVAGGVALASR